MGFLYIVTSKGVTKIGVTTDAQRCMKKLKPDKIFQIVELPKKRERELEKKLHRQFADKRLLGSDYFSLSWTECRRACNLARRAGKSIRFPYDQASRQVLAHWLILGVALGVCVHVLASL